MVTLEATRRAEAAACSEALDARFRARCSPAWRASRWRSRRKPRALPGALRDPRPVARSTTAIRSPRADDPTCSIRALFEHPTTQQPDPHLLPAGAAEVARQGRDFKARHVHVVGAGVMGGDIAAICAMRGITVTLQDTAPERIAPAIKRAAELFKRRLRDPRRIRDALDRLIPDVAGDGRAAAPTSSSRRSSRTWRRSASCSRSSRRWRSPTRSSPPTPRASSSPTSPPRSRIRRAWSASISSTRCRSCSWSKWFRRKTTRTEVAKNAAAFVRQIDKLPLPVKDSPGFLVNRVLGPYMQNAFRLIDEGRRSPRRSTRRWWTSACRWARPSSPTRSASTSASHAGKALAKAANAEVPKILAEKVAAGQLGRKTGQGIYRWENGKPREGRSPTPTTRR